MLLRVMAGEEQLDKGEILIPGNISIGYLPQESFFDLTITPLDLVLKPFAHLLDASHAYDQVANADAASLAKATQSLSKMTDEMHAVDAYSLPARAEELLAGLAVPQPFWGKPMSALSGGFRMRVLLAQLLLRAPDFLLLDEPTNHLDMDSLIWLERMLIRFKGGMLIVSHDRDFLSRVTTNTAELSAGSLLQYTGSIDAFFAWKTEQSELIERRRKTLLDHIEKTELFINTFKSKATKAAAAQSKMKQLEKLKAELPPAIASTKTVRFSFPDAPVCGVVPILCSSITVGYGVTPVFENLSLSVKRGDRIALIGPNGAGKSTLLKACAGIISSQSGTIALGHNVTLRYFSQHRLDQLDADMTLFDTIGAVAHSSNKTHIQSILGAFLFSGDEALKKVGVLSGGEKSRVSLATILADPGNVLLLDEPTNHLDIETIDLLGEALCAFNGTMIVVSHDERFISRIATRIIEMRPQAFRDFPGSFSDYRYYIENGHFPSLAEKQTTSETPSPETSSKSQRMQLREERKKKERALEKIEKQIEAAELESESLSVILADPSIAADFERLSQEHAKFDLVQETLSNLMHEWESLSVDLAKLAESPLD